MKKITVAVVLAVVLGIAGTVEAQSNESEHPEFLVGDRGYEWVSASRMLNDDGSLNVEFASQTLLDYEHQKDWPCQLTIVSSRSSSESGGYFATSLLLSDVAVRATIDDIVPGFSPGGEPALLLSLSDVVPLRDQTPLPDYALMRVERMEVGDRVFCEINEIGRGAWSERIPLSQVGDIVAVIGRWTSDSVVRMGLYRHTGALGVVGDDGESLEWHFSAFRDGPKTLSDLRRQIDDAAASGLLDATRGIARDDRYSIPRRNLAVRVIELQRRGCRIDSVEQHEDDLTFLHTCPDAQK